MPAVTFTARATDPLGAFGQLVATGQVVAASRPQIIAKHLCEETPAQVAAELDYTVINTLYPFQSDALAAQIKAINPRVVVLRYDFPSYTWSYFPYWTTINAHEDWFLHTTTPISSANRVTKMEGTSRRYLMDVGNAGYRAFIANYFAQHFASYPAYDGLFHDGAYQTAWVPSWGWETGHFPTVAQISGFHGWMVGFLSAIRTAISPRRLIVNSTGSSPGLSGYISDADFLPVVDGTLIEGFGHHPGHPADMISVGEADWNYQLQQMERNISQGKEFHAYSGMTSTNYTLANHDRWRLLCYAAYLLKQSPNEPRRGVFTWRYNAHACNWDAYYAANHAFFAESLGAPLGADFIEASGLRRRDFQNKIVRVNTTGVARGGLAAYTASIL